MRPVEFVSDYKDHRCDAGPDSPNSALVDEDFADWFGVGGPASYVADPFSALVSMGIDYFSVGLSGAENESFATDVMPAVRSARS